MARAAEEPALSIAPRLRGDAVDAPRPGSADARARLDSEAGDAFGTRDLRRALGGIRLRLVSADEFSGVRYLPRDPARALRPDHRRTYPRAPALSGARGGQRPRDAQARRPLPGRHAVHLQGQSQPDR